MKTISIFFVALSILFLTACGTEAEESRDRSGIPVNVVPVLPTHHGIPIRSSGKLGSKRELKLSFKIGGLVAETYVSEGSYVKKGQLLARLNTREIDAEVHQAQTALSKVRRDLDRVERLYRDTVSTLEQVQDLQTAQELAEADLEIATFNQTYALIYAPTSGRILRQFAEKGEILSPGTPVYLLGGEENSKVMRVGLSDKEVVRIALGDLAKLSFDALPGEPFEAEVTEIAAGANPANGTYEVELTLITSHSSLKNGFVGRVSLFPKASSEEYRIPLSALVEGSRGKALVYRLDSSRSRALPLLLHDYQLSDSFLHVKADQLDGIEEVITEGGKYLFPKAPITLPQDSTTLSHK